MSEFVEQFKSNIDADSARSDFLEITDSRLQSGEGPATSSMADKYILSIMVLLSILHSSLENCRHAGRGRAVNFVLSVVIWLIDTTGVMGFVICMLILTKINHYKFLHFWKVDNILASDLLHYPTIVETDGCSGVDRGFL